MPLDLVLIPVAFLVQGFAALWRLGSLKPAPTGGDHEWAQAIR